MKTSKHTTIAGPIGRLNKSKRLRRHWQLLASLLIIGVASVISFHTVRAASHRLTYIPRQLSECQNATAKDYQCYAKYFADLDFSKGNTVALKDLEASYNSDDFVKSQCHQLAHIVGRTSFEKTGSLEKAYTGGDNFCFSGFYHGATEQAVKQLGAETIKQGVPTICQAFAKKAAYSLEHFNCVHGLGHGLMAAANYNLHDSLKLCDKELTDWEQQSCYGGVFMENVMVAVRGDGTGAYFKAGEPLYPCTAVETKFKTQCYLIQTGYILQHNGYSFVNAFEECSKADTGFADDCYQSAGRDAIGSVNNDMNATVAICRTAPAGPDNAEMLRNCMIGAEREYTSYYPGDDRVYELCAAFGSQLEQECRDDVASR